VRRPRWFSFGTTGLARLPLPFWAWQAYLFLTFSAIDEEWEAIGRFHPRLVLGLLVVLGLVGGALARRSDAPRPRAPGVFAAPGAGWLLAFLGTGFVSVMWAYDARLALPVQVQHATHVASFFATLLVVRTRRQVLVTVLVVVAALGFFLLRSSTEFLAGRHDFTMGVRRMLGAGRSTADPNSFAATLAFAIPLVVWTMVGARSRLLKVCCLAFLLLGAAGIVLARSRSGLVLLVLASLWTLLQLRGTARVALVGLLVGLGAFLARDLTVAAQERFRGILSLETLERDPSAHGRIEGYVVSWDLFLDHPVVGVGPGNWAAYRAERVDGNRHEPHNLGGQLLAERGLLGAVPFLAYLAATVGAASGVRRRGLRSPAPWSRAVGRLASVVLATFALLFVSGLGAHNLDRHAWYLLPALLAVAARPSTGFDTGRTT
jgi:O-antigen ligase